MFRATNGQLLTKCCQHRRNILNNIYSEEEPSRDVIVEATKYLKDNKAAGSNSLAAKLLKIGGPSLLNALN
jgi:hypothetical protein